MKCLLLTQKYIGNILIISNHWLSVSLLTQTHNNNHISFRPKPMMLLQERPPMFVPVTIRSTRSHSNPSSYDQHEDESVKDLRVPLHWLLPSKAHEESEWLRVSLHKWLDDEYCPEETNVEISKVAARSYYESLVEKQTDLGEILLRMARELESISYQDSFHGAFSSANAAVNLIVQRLELQNQQQ